MCSHSVAAQRRRRPPKWVAILTAPGDGQALLRGTRAAAQVEIEDEDDDPQTEEDDVPNDAEQDTHESEGDEHEQDENEDEFYVGWDSMLEKAWRVPPDAPDTVKEFACSLHGGDSVDEFGPVVAVFSDGFREPVPGLIVGQWRARPQANMSSTFVAKSSSFERDGYKARQKLDNKKKRLLLLTRSDTSKQVCQIGVDMMPTADDAMVLMKELVERLVDKPELDPYQVRNELLELYRVRKKTLEQKGHPGPFVHMGQSRSKLFRQHRLRSDLDLAAHPMMWAP